MSTLTKESFKAGDFIFFEGDQETHFFIIESGEVSIFIKNQQGQKIELSRIIEGETFGEFAIIDNGARTATAQAVSDVKAMRISAEGYDMMLNDLPLWASSMLKSFANRLKKMNSNLKNSKSV